MKWKSGSSGTEMKKSGFGSFIQKSAQPLNTHMVNSEMNAVAVNHMHRVSEAE